MVPENYQARVVYLGMNQSLKGDLLPDGKDSIVLSTMNSALTNNVRENDLPDPLVSNNRTSTSKSDSFRSTLMKVKKVMRVRGPVVAFIWDGLVIGLIFGLCPIITRIGPYERIIFKGDPSLMYPLSTGDIVPAAWLPIVCYVVPMIILASVMALGGFQRKRLLVAFLGLSLAVALTTMTTIVTKNMVGRPRPDFYDRCKPDLSREELFCTGDSRIIREGRKSFPSGHSSTSFAGLGFAGFFLFGQLHVFDGRGRTWSLVVSLAPFLGALMVAVSRVMDYKHHWQDVLVGGLLGTFFAYLCYRLYFPPLQDELCYEPLDARFKDFETGEDPNRTIFQDEMDASTEVEDKV